MTLANRSDIELQTQHYAEAAQLARRAGKAFDAIGDVDGSTTSTVNEAIAHLYFGDLDHAESRALEGLASAGAIDDAYALACAYLVLAGVAAERGAARRSGVLVAASRTARDAVGIDLEPTERMLLERIMATADSDFAAGEREGLKLSLPEARSYAFNETEPVVGHGWIR